MADLVSISQTCVLQHLRAAARRVTQAYEAALKPVDLTASQFSTLVAIARDEGVPISDLAARLGMDRTTMPRVLAPLERRGLVAVRISDADSRVRGVFLGEAAAPLLDEARGLWDEAQGKALAQLAPDDWAAIRAALARLGQE
jgi:DNA-binding MarR family transcriptional regulator